MTSLIEILNRALMGKTVKVTQDRSSMFNSENPEHWAQGWSEATILNVFERPNGAELRFFDFETRRTWGIEITPTTGIELVEE